MKRLVSTTALIFVLALSGTAYAHEDGHEDAQQYPHCEKALSKLPKDKAEMFRYTMEQVHKQNEPLMERSHKLHEEMHAIVTAPKFDKDAFLSKSKELQKLHSEMHGNWKEGLASAFEQLSQSERKQLSESMHHGHKHHEHAAVQHNEPDGEEAPSN